VLPCEWPINGKSRAHMAMVISFLISLNNWGKNSYICPDLK
jgi:hypothetical protein